MSAEPTQPQPAASPVAGLGAKLSIPTERVTPTFQNVVVTAGGALFAAGLIAIGKDSRGGVIAVSLLAVALGAGLLFVPMLKAIRPAGIAMLVVGALQAIGAITIDPDSNDLPDAVVGLIIVAVLFAAALLVPNTRGRPLFVGGALLALWGFIMSLYVDSFAVFTLFPVQGAVNANPGFTGAEKGAYLSLIIGFVYIAAVWYLDQQGERALATPVAVAGIVAIGWGANGAISSDNFGRGLVALLVGVAAAWVGAQRQRRATTWAGGVAIAAGVYAIVDSWFDPVRDAAAPIGRGGGFVLLLFGLLVIGGGAYQALMAEGVFDQIKNKTEEMANSAKEKADAVAQADADATQAADWYPDPSGRNEMRYFDGTNWTEHVSNQGERTTDPPV